MISNFFIRRPIFACVISAFIVLAGLGGISALPIAAYPNIIPPQVTVTAVYPGATAETIAETVAAPLEEQINGVEGMLYMQSINAGDGTLTINVTFEVGADPDLATINVNNRVTAAVPRLPEEARRQGVVVRKASASIPEPKSCTCSSAQLSGSAPGSDVPRRHRPGPQHPRRWWPWSTAREEACARSGPPRTRAWPAAGGQPDRHRAGRPC